MNRQPKESVKNEYTEMPKRPEMTPTEKFHYDNFISFMTTIVEKYGKSVLEDDEE